MENSIYKDIYTDEGSSLYDMSQNQSVLLVFLRHFGCIFCREAMVEIASKSDTWKNQGIKTVLVHLSDRANAEKYFSKYGIKDIESISDPEAQFYKAFGLGKGKTSQLIGLHTMIRGFQIMKEKSIYPLPYFIGDGFQMPGVFLLRDGVIADSFIHRLASDAPDYEKLIQCCGE